MGATKLKAKLEQPEQRMKKAHGVAADIIRGATGKYSDPHPDVVEYATELRDIANEHATASGTGRMVRNVKRHG
jgi:hypothetical protein